jgi:hypothetical protein
VKKQGKRNFSSKKKGGKQEGRNKVKRGKIARNKRKEEQ